MRHNLTQIRVFTAIVSLIFSIYAIYFDDIINKKATDKSGIILL